MNIGRKEIARTTRILIMCPAQPGRPHFPFLEYPPMVAKAVKQYAGRIDRTDPTADPRSVTVDGVNLRPPPGMAAGAEYAWGYGGTGTRDLADALCLDLTGSITNPLRDAIIDMLCNLDEDADWDLTSAQIGDEVRNRIDASAWPTISMYF